MLTTADLEATVGVAAQARPRSRGFAIEQRAARLAASRVDR